jgi:hypothetical protein
MKQITVKYSESFSGKEVIYPKWIDFVIDVTGIKGYASVFQQLVRKPIKTASGFLHVST